MARIRTIKPQFFTSLTLAELGAHARLTFAGLWTHVDDEGRCINEPRLIKAAVWPLDDDVHVSDVERYVDELAKRGLVTLYTNAARRYLAVTTWAEHQSISRPTASQHPGPDDPDSVIEDSRSPHGALIEDSSPEGNKEEGIRNKEIPLVAASDDDTEPEPKFEDFWQAYPRHPDTDAIAGGGAKAPALKRWAKLKLDEKRACMVAVHHYRADVEARNVFVKHPVGWLNERRWEGLQNPVPPPKARGQPAHAASDCTFEERFDEARWD